MILLLSRQVLKSGENRLVPNVHKTIVLAGLVDLRGQGPPREKGGPSDSPEGNHSVRREIHSCDYLTDRESTSFMGSARIVNPRD